MNRTNAAGDRLRELVRVFLKLGALSYGGPAIMGIMQAEIQEKRQWMSKQRFLEGLALVNMLPGPTATQLGIFIGYDRAGWRGGVIAGICFILPAFGILMSLTLLYSAYGSVGLARDAFYGVGPVVLGIFIAAVWRLARPALQSAAQIVIAVAAAAIVGLGLTGVATALLLAGCAGVTLYHSRMWGLGSAALLLSIAAGLHLFSSQLEWPVADEAAGRDLFALGIFFLKVGAFTFGGGITVLAFVQEQVVNQLQWLTAQEFLDGLALGQLTPGPTLMLAAYVGYKIAGFVGAAVSSCAIFLPAFVLMLSILPAMVRFKDILWVRAATRGITAAVIGALSVSLLRLLPHAAPDAFTVVLLVLTVFSIAFWRVGPLPLILGGAAVGVLARLKPLQRLRDLA